jgi:hypothetical protein
MRGKAGLKFRIVSVLQRLMEESSGSGWKRMEEDGIFLARNSVGSLRGRNDENLSTKIEIPNPVSK